MLNKHNPITLEAMMQKEARVPSEDGQIPRYVTKVEVTYHLESDPEGTERTLTATHGGKGEVVDAMIWGEALMKKVAYLENGECREPVKKPGEGGWKVKVSRNEERGAKLMAMSAAMGAPPNDCVWFHTMSCDFLHYCSEIE